MAAWATSLRDAVTRNRRVPESKYLTLSSLSLDGWPSARTVVFRGLHGEGMGICIKLVSDARSRKHDELRACSRVELCWYLPKTSEQFRIRGTVACVGEGEADPALARLREGQWKQMGDASRAPFRSAASPGSLFEAGPGDLPPERDGDLEPGTGRPLGTPGGAGSAGPPAPLPCPTSAASTPLGSSSGSGAGTQRGRLAFPPPDPAVVRALRESRKTGEEVPSCSLEPAPSSFVLLLVQPVSVEQLCLRAGADGAQRRLRYSLAPGAQGEPQWLEQQLNP